MRKLYFFSLVILFFSLKVFAQKEQIVVKPSVEKVGVFLGESAPLRDLLPEEDLERAQQLFQDAKKRRKELEFERNPEMKQRRYPFLETALPKGPDPIAQLENGQSKAATTTIVQNFEGQSGSSFPLDCNGAVGPNHFMQTINLTYTIYNKSGTKLAGPTNLNAIFSGVTGSSCNDGDPIIMYDENADRWFFSEFSLCGSNDYMLIAVSTTNDPTGTWYKYSFDVDDVPDYMKFGIWRDGYYMAVNNPSGKDVYVFQRDVMLSGGSSPKMVGFDNPNRPNSGFHCIMPADNDWTFAPTGTPGIFLTINDDSWGGSDQLWIYQLQVNWTNTSNSTFSRVQTINVPSFSSYFGSTTWDDITQPGTSQKLDGIPTILMFRAQYVNFGTEERIVCTHTVNVGSNRAGLRWYELSRTTGTSTWSIRQSGTYAPNDGLNRWCAGISINNDKQIALMYNVTGVSGGTNIYPGIRICGQSAAANAAANGTMDIAETIIVNGQTYQSSYNRWGDYTQLSVDPVDKKTFWGTTAYMKTSTSTKYTKIIAFRFDEPLNQPPVADFIGSPTTLIAGSSVTFTDQSSNNPTSWQWSFPGGTPSSSTQQNPVVTYNTPGTYDVTLTATNAYGNHTVTKTGYITVLSQSQGFSLDFEACSDWSTDFSPWISLDVDGKATYQSSDCNFSAEGSAFGFIAFNPSQAGCFATHGGQRCGAAICPSDATQADNWIISPAIPMQTGGSISFWVQSPKPGTWGDDVYDVLVSTTNQSTSSFTAIASNQQAPSTWTQKTYDLSAYNNQTIYVAIRHRSTDKFILFIDDIVINPGSSSSGTPPTANFIGTPTSLTAGNSVTFTDQSTNNPTSWQWSFPGGTPSTSTQQNPVVTYNTPGTYSVTLIVSNQYGSDTLTKTNYITVTSAGAPPVADFVGNPTTLTAGNTVTFTDQSTNNPTSWQWSFPGGTPSTSTQQNPVVTYNTPGTYSVTLKVTNQYGADSLTKTNYITVANSGQGFSLDFEACADWSTDFTPWISLDVDGKVTYGSSDCNFPGEQTAFGFMAFNPSQAGCFAAHGGQRCGAAICPADASQADNWIISPALNMQIGGSISFWVQSPKPGNWGNDVYDVLVSTTSQNTSSFTAIASNQQAPSTWTQKTYDLSAYNNQTIYLAIRHRSTDKFILFIDDIVINPGTAPALPTASFTASATQICQNGSITFTNTSTNASSYQWTFQGGNPATSTSQSPTVTYPAAGTYPVTLIALNGQYSDTSTTTIIVNPLPTVTINASLDTICQGEQVTLTASGANTYAWSNGVQNGVPFTPAQTATYTVTATSSEGCTATAQLTITVNVLPNVTINASSSSVCQGEQITLTASGANTYAWSNGVQNGVPFAPTQTTTYTVTATSSEGCTATAQQTVTVHPLPTITIQASANPVCEGNSLILTASGAQSYSWNNNVQNGVAFVPQTSQTYYVTGIDANGCTNSDSIHIPVSPQFNLTAQVTDESSYGASDGSIDLTISGGVPPYTIQWSNGATSEDLANLPAGTYTVNVINADGCITSLTVVVGTQTVKPQIVDEQTRLMIYPNPTRETIVLAIRSNNVMHTVLVTVFDQLERPVIIKTIQADKKSLDEVIVLDDLSYGVYYVKVIIDGKVWTGKLIKK